MKRVNVDGAVAAVKEFLRELPLGPNGVELELDGRIIGRFVPELSAAEKAALIARGRELVQRSRKRNETVSTRALAQKVHPAVRQVRRRRR